MRKDVAQFCVLPGISVLEAVAKMDSYKCGLVLAVDDERRLLGIITDGDIRRAVLSGMDFRLPVQNLLDSKAKSGPAQPIFALVDSDPQTYLNLIKQHNIFHLPIVDKDGYVVGLIMANEFLPEGQMPMEAVIMAGGLGSRLRPLTIDVPKPMLPVGNRPLLELIVEQLQRAGIRKVNVTTHYKPELITNHFGDGKGFGVDIRYVKEDRPLGTAGALGLLGEFNSPLLVINGDVVTRVDFRRMMEFHREHRADMTIAVRPYDFRIPYGIVEIDGVLIKRVVEKPVFRKFINAGIYLLNPDVCLMVDNGQPCEMPDLINLLVEKGSRIVGFPVHEYWIDIGEKDQYERVQKDLKAVGV